MKNLHLQEFLSLSIGCPNLLRGSRLSGLSFCPRRFAEVPKKKSAYEVIREQIEENGISEAEIVEFVRKRDPKLRADAVDLETMPPAYVKYIKENLEKVIKNILKNKEASDT